MDETQKSKKKKNSIRIGRSLSFPVPSPSPSKSRYQTRSVSLPARLHPLVSQIETEIRSLRSWNQNPVSSSAWITEGLSRIDHLQSSFSDLLSHPQARDPLRSSSRWSLRLLEDSLRFADAHAGFRSAVISLNQQLSASRAAARHRDAAALASASRLQKQTEKQLLCLAADARALVRIAPAIPLPDDADLARVVNEVTTATAAASAAAFAGVAMVASAAVAGLSPKCGMLWRPAACKKRAVEEGERLRERAMARIEAAENSISLLEPWSHRVLRTMLNTRVFLLNTRTPTLETHWSHVAILNQRKRDPLMVLTYK